MMSLNRVTVAAVTPQRGADTGQTPPVATVGCSAEPAPVQHVQPATDHDAERRLLSLDELTTNSGLSGSSGCVFTGEMSVSCRRAVDVHDEFSTWSATDHHIVMQNISQSAKATRPPPARPNVDVCHRVCRINYYAISPLAR